MIFVGKKCVFVSRPMKIVTFLLKNGDHPKRVDDFPLERDTFRNEIMEIVEDFDEKSYNNNGKPWKSSRILSVNPFFHFLSFFIMFLHFLKFFHFFICSFLIFFNFSFFIFSFFHLFIFIFHFSSSFHFLSFSFIFFHFLTISFMFFLFFSFLLFLFLFVGTQNSVFFGPQFRYDFSSQFLIKKIQCFGPSRCTPLRPLFLFFSSLFSSFFFFFFLDLVLLLFHFLRKDVFLYLFFLF